MAQPLPGVRCWQAVWPRPLRCPLHARKPSPVVRCASWCPSRLAARWTYPPAPSPISLRTRLASLSSSKIEAALAAPWVTQAVVAANDPHFMMLKTGAEAIHSALVRNPIFDRLVMSFRSSRCSYRIQSPGIPRASVRRCSCSPRCITYSTLQARLHVPAIVKVNCRLSSIFPMAGLPGAMTDNPRWKSRSSSFCSVGVRCSQRLPSLCPPVILLNPG